MRKIFRFYNPELLFILFLGFVYYYQFLIDTQNTMIYNMQYFLYDYSFGFIKRGLLGEILSYISDYYPLRIIHLLSFIFIIILSLFVIKIIDLIKFKYKFYNYYLLCLLFLYPGLLKNLWFDIGRLDIFPMICCSCFIFLSATDKLSILKNIFLLASPLLLLVHEANLVLWLPTIYICWLLNMQNRYTGKKMFVYSLSFVFISLFISLFIQLYGSLDTDISVFRTYIQSKTDTRIMIEKAVLIDKPVDPIEIFSINFFQYKSWIYGLTTLSTLIYIIYLIFSLNNINIKRYIYYILIPLLISCSIFFLGYDALRWFCNISFIIFFIALSILINNNKLLVNNIIRFDRSIIINKISFLLLIILLFSLFTHLGIMHSLEGYIPDSFKK